MTTTVGHLDHYIILVVEVNVISSGLGRDVSTPLPPHSTPPPPPRTIYYRKYYTVFKFVNVSISVAGTHGRHLTICISACVIVCYSV